MSRSLLNRDCDSFPCGRVSSKRSSNYYWLTRHDRVGIVPVHLAVFIHKPRHRLRISVYVRRRYVAERTDDFAYEREECSGEPLQFVFGKEFRVNCDASFRASEWNACDRALPRHPHGQRLYLFDGNVGVVSDSTLVRSQRVVVLASESLIEKDSTIVHFYREVNAENPSRLSKNLLNVLVQLHQVSGPLELFHSNVVLGFLHAEA